MTLCGARHKLRTDPILKFLIVSLSLYGMSTFEGPMLSIKTVNALGHDTDWIIGHPVQFLDRDCGQRNSAERQSHAQPQPEPYAVRSS